MRVSSAFWIAALPALVAARGMGMQRYAAQILGVITYISYTDSSAFGVWVQLAHETVGPIFKKTREVDMTILMPTNEAFDTWITSQGGNGSDPGSLTTKAWESVFAKQFEYFFFKGLLNVSAVPVGETVILESFKQSPVGDWPLTTSFRRETSDPTDNGTFYSTAGSAVGATVNVSIPNTVAGPHCWAQVLTGWIAEPQNLSVTIEALNISSWSQIASRLPSIAALETTQNFTLFLPPESALSSALTLSDSALLAFVEAHLVQGSHVVLSSAEQSLTTAAGGSLVATASTVVLGDVSTNVTRRDVITNGGIVQAISASLISLDSASSNSTVVARELADL